MSRAKQVQVCNYVKRVRVTLPANSHGNFTFLVHVYPHLNLSNITLSTDLTYCFVHCHESIVISCLSTCLYRLIHPITLEQINCLPPISCHMYTYIMVYKSMYGMNDLDHQDNLVQTIFNIGDLNLHFQCHLL